MRFFLLGCISSKTPKREQKIKIGGPLQRSANEKDSQKIRTHFKDLYLIIKINAKAHNVEKKSNVPSVTAILPSTGINNEVARIILA